MPLARPALGHEHDFLGTGGNAVTCNAAFMATITGEGPLRFRNAHVLVAMLGALPALGADHRTINFRQIKIFYALLSKVLYENIDLPFVPKPVWLGHWVRNLCNVGTPTTAVDDIQALRIRVEECVVKVSDVDRTLQVTDVVAVTPAAPPQPLGWAGSTLLPPQCCATHLVLLR